MLEEDQLRNLKKIVPQFFFNDMLTKDFRDWPTAKEWVLEMSRRMATHGRSSMPVHLAETERAGAAAR